MQVAIITRHGDVVQMNNGQRLIFDATWRNQAKAHRRCALLNAYEPTPPDAPFRVIVLAD